MAVLSRHISKILRARIGQDECAKVLPRHSTTRGKNLRAEAVTKLMLCEIGAFDDNRQKITRDASFRRDSAQFSLGGLLS